MVKQTTGTLGELEGLAQSMGMGTLLDVRDVRRSSELCGQIAVETLELTVAYHTGAYGADPVASVATDFSAALRVAAITNFDSPCFIAGNDNGTTYISYDPSRGFLPSSQTESGEPVKIFIVARDSNEAPSKRKPSGSPLYAALKRHFGLETARIVIKPLESKVGDHDLGALLKAYGMHLEVHMDYMHR